MTEMSLRKSKPSLYDSNGVIADRTMARIVKIDAIVPINGANSIELCHVMGWSCVVKKDEFKVNDLCIYICIDSILDPMNPNFSFLEGRPLKSKSILNTLSQGLVGPLQWISDLVPDFDLKELNIDQNVTELLKVRKYVPPAELYEYDVSNDDNTQLLRFPSFVPKTDEERIQNLKHVLTFLPGQNIIITRKEDGTSTTFMYFIKGTNCHNNNNNQDNDNNDNNDNTYNNDNNDNNDNNENNENNENKSNDLKNNNNPSKANQSKDKDKDKDYQNNDNLNNDNQNHDNLNNEIISKDYQTNDKVYMMCGRNRQITGTMRQPSYKHYFEIEKKFDIKKKMQTLDRHIAIQGEIVGPKINGNKLKLTELDYRVFNIYDIDNKYYLPWDQVVEITDILGLNRVPLIYQGICEENMANYVNFMNIAESLEYTPGHPAEGIVVKTDKSKEYQRHSFKVISNKFLLKNK